MKAVSAKVLSGSGTDIHPVGASAKMDQLSVLLASSGTGSTAVASAIENAVLRATNRTPTLADV